MLFYFSLVVSSCKEAIQEELGNKDGEYLMRLNPKCNRPVKVYCHDMHTSQPKEYLTLTQGLDNHARIYDRRLRPSIRNQCGGLNPGSLPYNEGGYTRFYKVRFDIPGLKIVPDDFQFASSAGKPIPYGTAGDCYSSNLGNCRKGTLDMGGLFVLRTPNFQKCERKLMGG
jgi:thrombospondin motif-containing protein 9